MSEMSAYEKMLQSGAAFKKIDMTQHTMPSLAEASGGNRGIGEQVESNVNVQTEEERSDDFEEFDSVMEQRISSLRNKMNGGKGTPNVGKLMTPTQKEITLLKKRIEKLEEALIVIMQTQEQLFE